MFKKLILLTLILINTSCTSSHNKSYDSKDLDNPFKSLPSYAVEIRDELRLIAKARDMSARANTPKDAIEQYRRELFAKLPNFDSRVSVDMTEEAHKIAEFIAAAAQYDYIKPTVNPLAPVIVNIRLEDVPLSEVLRELNAKVGFKAKIQVHTKPRRTVRLEYVND